MFSSPCSIDTRVGDRNRRGKDIDLKNESIAQLGHGFNESGLVGRVAERLAQSGDSTVQPMVEVHKRVGRPEALAQLVARDHFPGSLQEQRQHTERLFLYPAQPTFLTQFTRPKINLKDIKANYHRRQVRVLHRSPLLGRNSLTDVSDSGRNPVVYSREL